MGCAVIGIVVLGICAGGGGVCRNAERESAFCNYGGELVAVLGDVDGVAEESRRGVALGASAEVRQSRT